MPQWTLTTMPASQLVRHVIHDDGTQIIAARELPVDELEAVAAAYRLGGASAVRAWCQETELPIFAFEILGLG